MWPKLIIGYVINFQDLPIATNLKCTVLSTLQAPAKNSLKYVFAHSNVLQPKQSIFLTENTDSWRCTNSIAHSCEGLSPLEAGRVSNKCVSHYSIQSYNLNVN